MPLQQKPILCLDFDGVIHSYTSGWQGACVISDPVVPGFFEWARESSKYFQLVIYSSRSKEENATKAMRYWIVDQFVKLFPEGAIKDSVEQTVVMFPSGEYIEFSFAYEKPAAFLTIDDRAVCFKGIWSHPDLNPTSLSVFKPWNK